MPRARCREPLPFFTAFTAFTAFRFTDFGIDSVADAVDKDLVDDSLLAKQIKLTPAQIEAFNKSPFPLPVAPCCHPAPASCAGEHMPRPSYTARVVCRAAMPARVLVALDKARKPAPKKISNDNWGADVFGVL